MEVDPKEKINMEDVMSAPYAGKGSKILQNLADVIYGWSLVAPLPQQPRDPNLLRVTLVRPVVSPQHDLDEIKVR